MTRNRIIVLIALVALPIAFLIGVGSYHLWATGWFFWAWWPMAICLALAYILGWRWQKQHRRQMLEEPTPLHYTERDQAARKRIDERIESTDAVTVDHLGDARFYAEIAQAMAVELAGIYHPNARDPVGKLTVPEMLAVVELAAHDLGKMATDYLPGGHLVTIDHFRQAREAAKWYKHARNVFWGVGAVLDPVRTVTRYAAAQFGLGKPLDLLQKNVILWFYAAFIRRLGHYLIELYSGRLKVGVVRYRELLAEQEESKPVTPGDAIIVNGSNETAGRVRAVTIAVIGQVKAGKSSLINSLLGERMAVTDVIPATAGISRYELQSPGSQSKLVLLDTVGYNQAGPEKDQFETTVDAAQQADLILLVTHARNPGRDTDVKLWQSLKEWFVERPELKMPPVMIVLTHIDLLTPAMEWAPPYDWHNPQRPKETNIAEAAKTAQEQFGEGIITVVPVCSAEGKVFGIEQELLPEMIELLGQARAVAFLRCLHAEADEGKIMKVFDQLFAAGKLLLSSLKR